MKQSNYTVQIIEPNEGFYLTQKDAELSAKVFSKKVFLAVNDSVENWIEVSEAEAEELKRQQEELANKEVEEENN